MREFGAWPRLRSGLWLGVVVAASWLSAACSEAPDAEQKPGSGGSGQNGGTQSGGRPTGGGTPVSSDFPDAQLYVDAHNAVRAAVEAPSGYAGTWQTLPEVAWSNEVAASAQEWANHLRDSMDCGLEHAQGTGYGENLAAGSNVGAERAVEMWASEKKNYSYTPEYMFTSDTGHYTQIVWGKTTTIGCASAQCNRSTVVVCRYQPPGNVIGQAIF